MISQSTFTAIDFESAGTSPGQTDAPVQIGLATYKVGKGLSAPYMSHLHCDREITWKAQKVHGITPADLTHAPTLLSLWPVLRDRLSAGPVVAHGHGTEKRFLRAFPGHLFGPWVDTLSLSRRAWPQLESHSLGAVCEALQLSSFQHLAPGKTWHDALFDALASLAILERLIQDFDLARHPLDSILHP